MSGLDVAAGVIAVIQLSAKVASLCMQYSQDVTNAAQDILRVRSHITELENVLDEAARLLDSNDGARLQASQQLRRSLDACHSQLAEVEEKLTIGRSHRAMKRFGFRALKWPFTRQEVQKIVQDLKSSQTMIQMALQIDTAAMVGKIDLDLALSKLVLVEDAVFDSYRNQYEAKCHVNTRVDLLKDIDVWTKDFEGKCIYWLSGMAGTGKSTVAYTVAQALADAKHLGASFFFKRGEGDRGSAKSFFTTVTSQVVRNVPSLTSAVRTALEATPNISEKPLKEQFEALLLHPMLTVKVQNGSRDLLVIVIDALDECDSENDIKTILSLLSQTQKIKGLQFRVFVTSRPELPVRLGFRNMAEDVHHDVHLHEIAKDIIDHDLYEFLSDELDKIRVDMSLGADWPGTGICEELVQIASPLFIFAATMVRFIGDRRWDSQEQLDIVLKNSAKSQTSKLYQTYSPIFQRLLTDCDPDETRLLVEQFRKIVGSIILLHEPLTMASMSKLLNVPIRTIERRLDALHSVLDVPQDPEQAVRILHLSFRDFLVSPEKQRNEERNQFKFWIDRQQVHTFLAEQCLDMLAASDNLKQDICDLKFPGTLQSDIDEETLKRCLPLELLYACRFWIYHLVESMSDGLWGKVHAFLQRKLLYWIEAMSLMSRLVDALTTIETFLTLASQTSQHTDIFELMKDAKRFILAYRNAMEKSPLQIYCAALSFSPQNSVIRATFRHQLPKWITETPHVQPDWGLVQLTLEGHSSSIWAVAYSPDAKCVASGSHDDTVRLWDSSSGAALATLKSQVQGTYIWSVAFSPNGKILASGHEYVIRLWDVETGTELAPLEGHGGAIRSIAFSPTGSFIASGSHDHSVRTWNLENSLYVPHLTLEGHHQLVFAVAVSPDGRRIASGAMDAMVKLWDAAQGTLIATLEGHRASVFSIAFSPDDDFLASAGADGLIWLWHSRSGAKLAIIEAHNSPINSIACSHGKRLVSGTHSGTVTVWDADTREALISLEGHTDSVCSTVFSPNGKRIASGSIDKTVRLWDVDPSTMQGPDGDSNDDIFSVALSPDGQSLAMGLYNGEIYLSDTKSSVIVQTLQGHLGPVAALAFSPDGQRMASGSDDTSLRVWTPFTSTVSHVLTGHVNAVSAVAFSPDGRLIASGSHDTTIMLWDVFLGISIACLQSHLNWVTSVAFSLDGSRLCSGSDDCTVKLWNVELGALLKTLSTNNSVRHISFSADGSRLHTDQEILELEPSAPGVAQGQSMDLSLAGQWVEIGTRKILWLPPEFRPMSFSVQQQGILLAYRSGKVGHLKFDVSKMDFLDT